MEILKELAGILELAKDEINIAQTSDEIEALRIKYLGRKGGLITGMMSKMGSLSAEEKPIFGAEANKARTQVEEALKAKEDAAKASDELAKFAKESLDVTLPGISPRLGRVHPLTRVRNEVYEIMTGLGFEVVDSPEIETFEQNFAKLNYPDDHPAMDEQDTFYLENDLLLRTHTTAVQTRILLDNRPPVRCVYAGRVHRREQVTLRHSHTFHQIDGLIVDEGITFADLKGTLSLLFKEMFGAHTEMRFRADYFPFTEPSAEFSFTCFNCAGNGCKICSNTGFIEFGGSGMVHPNILRGVGIDPEKYSGFAFGFGLDRVAMFRYGVPDIRMWMENDIRFLSGV